MEASPVLNSRSDGFLNTQVGEAGQVVRPNKIRWIVEPGLGLEGFLQCPTVSSIRTRKCR